jgi:hypothetical protein
LKQTSYYTVEWALKELLKEVTLTGPILEPFTGKGAISRPLALIGHELITNDGVESSESFARFHLDLWLSENWIKLPKPNWIITSPPTPLLDRALVQSYDKTTIGLAILSKLAFLNPTYGRQNFLVEHPPHLLIVMPGLDDEALASAWFIWFKSTPWTPQRIKIVPKL